MFALLMSFSWQDFVKIYISSSFWVSGWRWQSQIYTDAVIVSMDMKRYWCRWYKVQREQWGAFSAERINLSSCWLKVKLCRYWMQLWVRRCTFQRSCSCSDGVATGSKGGSQHSFQTETDTRQFHFYKFYCNWWGLVFAQLSIKRIWKEPIPDSICLVKLSAKRRSCRSERRTQITERSGEDNIRAQG